MNYESQLRLLQDAYETAGERERSRAVNRLERIVDLLRASPPPPEPDADLKKRLT